MYELVLGFQAKQTKTSQQKKIIYNLNPDVNKKKKRRRRRQKKNINNKKKRFITLRNGKKTRNKKNIAFSPAPPATKKKRYVMLRCIYEMFRNRNVMGLNMNAYNTKTTPSTHS
jgi:hypothetical protein